MKKLKALVNLKMFGILLGAGVFGTLAVFPYLLTLQGEVLKELPIPLPAVLILSLLQTIILLSIAIFVGLVLGKKVGLGAPILENWIAKKPTKGAIKSTATLSVKLGVLTGVLIIGFDYIFSLLVEPLSGINAPLWQGFLGSFYGGVVEEILLRLFLVTLVVWLILRFSRQKRDKPTASSIWVAIIIAAIIFGIGHLPATAQLTAITPLVVIRAITLNGIGGVVFGWLYWKKGLGAAMVAHFTADIVLLVVFPFLF